MAIVFNSYKNQVLSSIDKAIARGMEIVGGMAESYAKGLAPVDTGNLRNSITHDVTDNGHTAVIGTDVKYAPYQELGAPNANVPAHPFLRPACENHMSEYENVLKTKLSNA